MISSFCYDGSVFAFGPGRTTFSQGGITMDNHDSKYSSPAVVLALLGGAVAGAVVGLLLAPRRGEETRGALKGYARKAEENLLEKAKEARVALDETIERGKHFIAEKAADAEGAAKAGGDVLREKIDTCCN
jgi:gas vesicle protein